MMLEPNISAKLKMEKETVKEYSIFKMEVFTKALGNKIKCMEKDHFTIPMDTSHMMVDGIRIVSMAKVEFIMTIHENYKNNLTTIT